MGRLKEIVTAHADRPAEKRRTKEQAEFAARMRREERLAEVRRAAMEAALPVTGRVIFPGRWKVNAIRRGNYEYRAYARWEGLRLQVLWGRGSAGAVFTLLEVYPPDGGEPKTAESPAALAALLREWGLDG